FWFSVLVGMTKSGGNDVSVAAVIVRFRLCWNFGKLMNRHSRAGGNLDFRTTAIFKDYLKV
ncbi:TPA: hypothetical protein ACRHKB_RS08115, partial [Neisseria meningitidis]